MLLYLFLFFPISVRSLLNSISILLLMRSEKVIEFFGRTVHQGAQAMGRRQRRGRRKEDREEAHRQRREGRPRRNPTTWGSHLLGRTKNRAETVLALILGRD
jgi:hypothetical protein